MEQLLEKVNHVKAATNGLRKVSRTTDYDVMVTPEMAKGYLNTMEKNRMLSTKRVAAYAKSMVEGRWKGGTGEALKFDEKGHLIDGQHRLKAVIQAGIPAVFDVQDGLDPKVFEVIDTGRNRTYVDVFSIMGITSATLVPAIISKVYFANREINNRAAIDERLSPAQLLELYQQRPEYWSAVTSKTNKWYLAFQRVMTPSEIGALYAFLSKGDEKINRADEFFDELCTGNGVTNSTILLLRNKLIADKISPTLHLTPVAKRALIFKTWNAYVKGKNLKRLTYEPNSEKPPKPLPLLLKQISMFD